MAFETFAVHAACIRGVEAIHVTVEVSLAGGVPGIQMLGIPSMEVMESRGRIRCAMRSAGFEIPRSGITVNLAPGDIRKTGSGFDLPIAIAVLAADGQIPRDNLDRCLIAGELGLDGTVLPVKGEVAFQLLARDMGLSFIAGRSDQHVPLAGLSTIYLSLPMAWGTPRGIIWILKCSRRPLSPSSTMPTYWGRKSLNAAWRLRRQENSDCS